MKLRSYLKLTLLWLAYGIAWCMRLPTKPLIVMYHSFDTTGWRYGVSPDDLRRQLEYLMQHRTIVPLADMLAYLEGVGDVRNDAVAITVDDGYADTYEVLFPLAKQYQLPFTLFLTTDLAPQENLGNLPRSTMEQLKEMADSGLVSFGLHGHTHRHFTKVLKEGVADVEITQSEQIIASLTGARPEFVAYPSGQYDDTVLAYFRNAGYRLGLSTHSGFVNHHDDLLRLRRVEVSRNVSALPLFRLRLTPALLVYNRMIYWFRTYVY